MRGKIPIDTTHTRNGSRVLKAARGGSPITVHFRVPDPRDRTGLLEWVVKSIVHFRNVKSSRWQSTARPWHGVANPMARMPSAQKRGAARLANLILDATSDGADLVDWCLALWKDHQAPLEWRWKAFEWLTDRGMGTRPNAQVLAIVNSVKSPHDLVRLGDEELEVIDAMFRETHRDPLTDKVLS